MSIQAILNPTDSLVGNGVRQKKKKKVVERKDGWEQKKMSPPTRNRTRDFSVAINTHYSRTPLPTRPSGGGCDVFHSSNNICMLWRIQCSRQKVHACIHGWNCHVASLDGHLVSFSGFLKFYYTNYLVSSLECAPCLLYLYQCLQGAPQHPIQIYISLE